jgi:hypothetical protein
MKPFLFLCLLACHFLIFSCNSGTQKTSNTDTAATHSSPSPAPTNASKVVFIDTTIGSRHFTVSFLPLSDRKGTDHFYLYVGVNGCYDSVRACYYGWDDSAADNKMYIAEGSRLVKTANILVDDSIVIISLQYNVEGVQLLFATLRNNCIKLQDRHLESDAPFIIFPKDHIIGTPKIRGSNSGEVYLDRYDGKDTLYEYTIINPHFSEKHRYDSKVLDLIRQAIDRKHL